MVKAHIQGILLSLFIIGGVINYNLPQENIKQKETPIVFASENSGEADKIDKNTGEIIGTYYIGKQGFGATSIPKWKYDIYRELGSQKVTTLALHTLNSLECGDYNGLCIGYNHADAGPFQINQIHDNENICYITIKRGDEYITIRSERSKWDSENCAHAYSEELVYKGRKELEMAKKTGDYTEFNKTRDTLFRFQAKWTMDRMGRYFKKCNKTGQYEDLIRCQAVVHNGNTKYNAYYGQFRYYYADKAVKNFRITYAYYHLTK